MIDDGIGAPMHPNYRAAGPEVGEGLLPADAVFVGEARWQRSAPSLPSVGQVVAKAGSTSLEEDEPRGSCGGSVPALCSIRSGLYDNFSRPRAAPAPAIQSTHVPTCA